MRCIWCDGNVGIFEYHNNCENELCSLGYIKGDMLQWLSLLGSGEPFPVEGSADFEK